MENSLIRKTGHHNSTAIYEKETYLAQTHFTKWKQLGITFVKM
jgi:hypothetical protein